MAVSYTHLDVYKRQSMDCTGLLVVKSGQLRAFILSEEGREKMCIRDRAIAGLVYSLFLIVYLLLPAVFSGYSPIFMSILCAVPVSYTHLDVYKRQRIY